MMIWSNYQEILKLCRLFRVSIRSSFGVVNDIVVDQRIDVSSVTPFYIGVDVVQSRSKFSGVYASNRAPSETR